jgi:hypothetical protein
MKKYLCTTAVWTLPAVLALTACATTSSPRAISGFEDIVVPRGFAYAPAHSTVIESPSVQAARLVYRGRVEPDSARVALRATMEANGWHHVSTTASERGIVQVYDKAGMSVETQIYEGLWFTYAVFTASRSLQSPAAASSAAPADGITTARASDQAPRELTPPTNSPAPTGLMESVSRIWQRTKEFVAKPFSESK